jgi:hypothetical protein
VVTDFPTLPPIPTINNYGKNMDHIRTIVTSWFQVRHPNIEKGRTEHQSSGIIIPQLVDLKHFGCACAESSWADEAHGKSWKEQERAGNCFQNARCQAQTRKKCMNML